MTKRTDRTGHDIKEGLKLRKGHDKVFRKNRTRWIKSDVMGKDRTCHVLQGNCKTGKEEEQHKKDIKG